MLLGDSAAVDVLQDTNLDLWAHIDDFDFARPFLPWAYTFAFHRVLAFRKANQPVATGLSAKKSGANWPGVYSRRYDCRCSFGGIARCLEKLDDKQNN